MNEMTSAFRFAPPSKRRLDRIYGIPEIGNPIRNVDRFPKDCVFQLAGREFDALRHQIRTLATGRGQHRKYLPFVFTEHGAIMAANVLNSPRAVQMREL